MNRLHRVLGITAAALGLGAAAADFRPAANMIVVAQTESEHDHITAIELAERIIARETGLQILDLRSLAEFEQFHIPSASHATLDEMAHRPFPRDGQIVLYSEDGTHSAQAWKLMRLRGYRNISFLREGIYEWISRVHEPRLAADATAAERDDFKRATEFSRFFGGVPLSDVPRSEVPLGYWTGSANKTSVPVKQAVEKIRRRGC